MCQIQSKERRSYTRLNVQNLCRKTGIYVQFEIHKIPWICLVGQRNKMPGAFRGLKGVTHRNFIVFTFFFRFQATPNSSIFYSPIPQIWYSIFMSPSMQTWQQHRTKFWKSHISESVSMEHLWRGTLSLLFHRIFQFFMSTVRVFVSAWNKKFFECATDSSWMPRVCIETLASATRLPGVAKNIGYLSDSVFRAFPFYIAVNQLSWCCLCCSYYWFSYQFTIYLCRPRFKLPLRIRVNYSNRRSARASFSHS